MEQSCWTVKYNLRGHQQHAYKQLLAEYLALSTMLSAVCVIHRVRAPLTHDRCRLHGMSIWGSTSYCTCLDSSQWSIFGLAFLKSEKAHLALSVVALGIYQRKICWIWLAIPSVQFTFYKFRNSTTPALNAEPYATNSSREIRIVFRKSWKIVKVFGANTTKSSTERQHNESCWKMIENSGNCPLSFWYRPSFFPRRLCIVFCATLVCVFSYLFCGANVSKYFDRRLSPCGEYSALRLFLSLSLSLSLYYRNWIQWRSFPCTAGSRLSLGTHLWTGWRLNWRMMDVAKVTSSHCWWKWYWFNKRDSDWSIVILPFILFFNWTAGKLYFVQTKSNHARIRVRTYSYVCVISEGVLREEREDREEKERERERGGGEMGRREGRETTLN